MKTFLYESPYYTLTVGGDHALTFRPRGSEKAIPVAWPRFEADGTGFSAAPSELALENRRFLNEDVEEIVLAGKTAEGPVLALTLRVSRETPFIRFRYRLSSKDRVKLTKAKGENLTYLAFPAPRDAGLTEIRFAVYDDITHGYTLKELPAFEHEKAIPGPILAETGEEASLLAAYEHGSMYPNVFIAFEKERETVRLRAVKGNYLPGHDLAREAYETVWLQFGAVAGGLDDLAKAYRAFQLSYCSLNRESRRPYIYYNTWAYQERVKFSGHQYLSFMDQARMEREIERAAEMGVDVFVIDTGWYEKTGDWAGNPARFPDGIGHLHDLLEKHGMKLGLWFAPCRAARSSRILSRHPGSIQRRGDEKPEAVPIWETEESYEMCPVSPYWEDFADRLIELAKTVGVRYFKWDAVEMTGCDAPGHFHGDESVPAEERRENYSFQVGLYMSKIAERVSEAIPDAIVDMDITEGNRYFGLGFLASGKFFSMNNGPYYWSYDIEVPSDKWTNIFVNPGPARSWFIRQNLAYDKWIPSVLMLAHYLPDDPRGSQLINLASLVLGQNGIWGDLPGVSEEGVRLFAQVLGEYKKVRDDVTGASPAVYGRPGETFEVHEKISGKTGRGLVSLFAGARGTYRYRLASAPAGDPVIFGPVSFRREEDGAWAELEAPGACAAILFFE